MPSGINKAIPPSVPTTTGNYLYIEFNQYVPDIIENDIISISGTTNFDGKYTVANVYRKQVITSSSHIRYVLEISSPLVPSHTTLYQSGYVTVFRNQTLDLTSPIRDYYYKNG